MSRAQILQRTSSILTCLAPWYVVLAVCLILSACATVDFDYRFDDDSTRLGEASLWEDWYDTVRRTNDELIAIQACIEDESKCDRDMRRIRLVITNGKTLQPEQQLQLINRYINRMRRYNEIVELTKNLKILEY